MMGVPSDYLGNKRKAQRMFFQGSAVYYTLMGASLSKFTLARFLDKIFPHKFFQMLNMYTEKQNDESKNNMLDFTEERIIAST